MFALLVGLMACGEKEVATTVATTEETEATEVVVDGVILPTAVYPETETVKQVAPDGGTNTLSGSDVVTTVPTTGTDKTTTSLNTDNTTKETK